VQYLQTGKSCVLILVGNTVYLLHINTNNICRYNAEILRQFSTYTDEYRKESNAFDNKAKCLLCVGDDMCEICSLKSRFRNELKQFVDDSEGPYRLDDLATHILSAGCIETSLASVDEERSGEEAGRTSSNVNILPVLLKMKRRGSLLKQNNMAQQKESKSAKSLDQTRVDHSPHTKRCG